MPFACTNSPEGMSTATPDVCDTPAGPDMVPIPYDNIAQAVDSDPATVSETVLMCGFNAATVISVILMSQGDDAGVGMGVMSGTILGPCQYKLGSATVMIEGTAATYMGTTIGHNDDPDSNCPIGVVDSPSQEMVQVAP